MKFRITLLLISICGILYGQTEEQMVPSELKFRNVVNEPITLKKGFLRVGGVLNYTLINQIFTEDGERKIFDSNIWSNGWFNNIIVEYGVSDKLQVDVQIPYYNETISGSNYAEFGGLNLGTSTTEISHKGLGDISVFLEYQIIPERNMGDGLTLTMITELPTGRKDPENYEESPDGSVYYERPTGAGEFTLSPELKFRKVFYPFSFEGFVGIEFPFGGEKITTPGSSENNSFKGSTVFKVSSNFNFMINDFIAIKNGLLFLNLNGETVNGMPSEEFIGGWGFTYFPFVSFQFRKLRIEEAVTIPLMGKSNGADISFFLMVRYLF